MSTNKNTNTEIDVCADCGQTDPAWASINHGVLICDQCAIIHRSLGRFLSQIKPLRCTSWRQSQLQMVYDLYRSGANSIWEHTLLDPHVLSSMSSGSVIKSFSSHSGPRKKPLPNDPLHPNKNDFIWAKYQSFCYVNKSHSIKDDAESEADISEQLHSSVRTPNLKTSLRLLAAGANSNFIHSEKFNSPLHMAAKSGQMSQIELLLIYGANLAVIDSRGKTAVDYAREAGHIEIVNRLIEHQFDLPDTLTRFICQGRQPNHKNGEHFLVVDIKPEFLNFLNNASSDADKSQNITDFYRSELNQSIQSLSHKSFQELARDIYDEIDRREVNSFVLSHYGNDSGKLTLSYQQLIIPFLPVYQFFSSTRNQGRQKLALLNTKEFTLLIVDVLNEIRRRVYGLNSLTNFNSSSSSKINDEFDDDSEPLYDSVPSEGDYDECNETIEPITIKNDFNDSSHFLNNCNNNDFVSKTDYSALKEQMIRSTNLMQEFLNENKQMRMEMGRLQTVVERLVEENVQLRQLVVPSKQNSSNSLNNNNNEAKSNSLLLMDSSDTFNRNSFLRGSNRVRPQSILSYSNSSNNNHYSNEGISMKAPSNMISQSLSQSPSKLSNSSLLNHQPLQQQQSNQLISAHNLPGVFVNSSNSSSSSLSSSQPPMQPNVNQSPQPHHKQQQQQQSYLPLTAESANQHYSAILNSFNNVSIGQQPNSIQNNKSFSSASTSLPSKDDVIKKIEYITHGIKELLCNAREGKHDEFQLCSERICDYISEMINLFPESIGSSKAENLLQINQALTILQENALRLHDECNSYELNTLPNIYNHHHKQPPNSSHTSNQDYRYIYNNVIDKAAEVASSVKAIVSLYSC